VTTKVKIGHQPCGFMNLVTCTIYGVKTRQVPVTHIGTMSVPDVQACKDHHVKCCNGFINIKGSCLGSFLFN
jgi:hypothetical protein